MVSENNTFRYSYSAAGNKEVEAIRKKYLPPEENKLDKLRQLDRRVQSAGVIPALAMGIVGALVFGLALCMGLDVLAGGMVGAVILSIFGLAAAIAAYPIYRSTANKTKAELTPEILRLADEITAPKTGEKE